MRKLIAWPAAWALFWLGFMVARPIRRWECMSRLYQTYTHLMVWSMRVQDWGGLASPWRYVAARGNAEPSQ